MKVSNLISFILVIDIPIMAHVLFICSTFFPFTNRKKQNNTGYLHGEEFFEHF